MTPQEHYNLVLFLCPSALYQRTRNRADRGRSRAHRAVARTALQAHAPDWGELQLLKEDGALLISESVGGSDRSPHGSRGIPR